MLVVSRKVGESIRIGDDITIMVVSHKGDKTRLGIEAPVEVPVHRQEIYERIKLNESEGDEPTAPAA